MGILSMPQRGRENMAGSRGWYIMEGESKGRTWEWEIMERPHEPSSGVIMVVVYQQGKMAGQSTVTSLYH